MIVIKSQVHTFGKIGLYIDQYKSIFENDKFYVELSRCQSKYGIKMQIVCEKNEFEKVSVKNVEFKVELQFHSFFLF